MKTTFLKLSLIAIIIVIGTSVHSYAQTKDRLFVYSTNGAEQSFALDDLQKITFTGQGINIHSETGGVTVLPYSDVSVITFESKSTAVTAVKNSNVKLYWETSNLIIESDTEISAVKLYDLQGTLLTNRTLQSLSANIPMSSCPAGVYIVQVINRQGASIHKIIKR